MRSFEPFSDGDLDRLEQANTHALGTIATGKWNRAMVLCWARMFTTLRVVEKERTDMKTALAAQCMKAINREHELVEQLAIEDRKIVAFSQVVKILNGRLREINNLDLIADVLGQHIPNVEKIKTLREIVNQQD